MYKLFVRITWFISICSGIIIAMTFSGRYFGGDTFMTGVILGVIVKYVFFSPKFIQKCIALSEIKDTITPAKKTIHSQNQDIGAIDDEENTVSQHFSHPLDTLKQETISPENKKSAEKVLKPRESSVLEKFFSENLLAKLGGILVFLGVLFLLSLVYTVVGPVTKLIIGTMIGFSVYAVGLWLDTKKYTHESRILLSIGILIIYLVILSGRYLIGSDESVGDTILSTGLTLLFLIANTGLAILTALIYKSRALLIFSFIFAYGNILLIGEKNLDTYMILGYTMLVSFGAFFISYIQKDRVLFALSYIIASIFILFVPFESSWQWILKLFCIDLLGIIGLIVTTRFTKEYKYAFELLIGGIFFMIGIIGILGVESINPLQLALIGASSLGLLGLAYAQMNKGVYLYSIGTLGTIAVLTPAILVPIYQEKEGMMMISIILVLLFFIMNIGTFFIKQKILLVKNIGNIMGGLISGALFMTFMAYNLGEKFFPGIAQGLLLLVLAIIYFTVSYIFIQQVGLQKLKEDIRFTYMFSALSALAISIFSLSIIFVFAEQKEIISIVWILESTILFYIGQKLTSQKIALGGLALLIIGSMSIVNFIEATSLQYKYGLLIASAFIFLCLILNLFFILQKKNDTSSHYLKNIFIYIHHFFHIFALAGTVSLGLGIFDFRDDFLTLSFIATILAVLGYIYGLLKTQGLQYIHIGAYLLLLFTHVIIFTERIGYDEKYKISLLTSSFIPLICGLPFVYEYITKKIIGQRSLFAIYLIYLFTLSSLYIYYLTEITFVVTFYWGALSFLLLAYGIQKDIVLLRTLGLYIVTLTASKVFFYDIWVSVDDTISRVVALIIVGILMIVLSTMYTRKYGNTLNSEFNPRNIFGEKKEKNRSKTQDGEKNILTGEKEKSVIQKNIESVNIDGISGVRIYINGDKKNIQIRAQNLIKIAKLIESSFHKTSFEVGELSSIQDTILKNYTSSLSPDQFKKIKEIIQEFVQKGGKIEFIKKDSI